MIRIVNLRNLKDLKFGEVVIRVDRRSPLGNPFHMRYESERDKVCDQYEAWLPTVKDRPDIAQALDDIREYALENDVALACWCYPKRCHAESIIKILG